MKKLSKIEKENRIRKFRKVKDIILYVSLALNTLFLVCCVVVGCSSKSDDHTTNLQNNIAKKLLVDRNNAVEVATNQDWQCYDLATLAIEKINENNVYYNQQDIIRKNVDYEFSLICGDEVMVGANAIYVEYDLRLTSLNARTAYIGVAAYESVSDPYTENPLCVSMFRYENEDYRGTWHRYNMWVTNSSVPPQPTQYNSDDGFYITYAPVTYDNNNMLDWFIPNFFNTIEYIDFDLSTNWSPFALYMGSPYIPTTNINGHYEDLLTFTQFVSNGNLYDQIRVVYTGANYPVYTSNGTKVNMSQIETIYSVSFRNSYSGHSVLVMANDPYITSDGSQGILENSLHFVNYANSSIRLFDINLNERSNFSNSYSNYDIFNLQSNYAVNSSGGNAGLGDVFGLFKTAFNGLAGLFSIAILPNITLGMLLFLPLIGGIIFAILKIIKK